MEKVTVKVILDKGVTKPMYMTEGAAGMDVRANITEPVTLGSLERKLIPTGIKMEIPMGYEVQVRPRSGLALKHSITVLNTPGTIDEGYRGEIGVILINHGKETFVVEKHMKIAQMVVKPIYEVNVVEVEELTDSERGEGGFGSTGTK